MRAAFIPFALAGLGGFPDCPGFCVRFGGARGSRSGHRPVQSPGFVRRAVSQEIERQTQHSPCQSYQCRPQPAPVGDPMKPALQRLRRRLPASCQRVRRLDPYRAHLAAPLPRDSSLLLTLSTGPHRGHNPKVAGHLLRGLKALHLIHRGHQRESTDFSHARNRLQPLHPLVARRFLVKP